MQIRGTIKSKEGLAMNRYKTDEYELEYIESEVSSKILWENHCHGQFEMIAVEKGDINIMLEGKSYRLKKGQAAIISPLFYHSVTANEKGSYKRVTVLFGITAVPAVIRKKFESLGISIANLPISWIDTVKKICQKRGAEIYAPLAQSLMIQAFYEAVENAKSPVESETDELLQKSIAYIDAHLHEKILLEDLARNISRSKSSFCHLFEEKMHISPKQYIQQKKLALASKLIGEGVPKTKAALMIGYENYSNFYRIYQKNIKN